MTRPSIHVTLLEIARVMGARSTCSRAQVGAVLAVDGRIISTGFNGAPRGQQHCTAQNHPPVTPSCTVAVHAEANAVAFAARVGMATEGATLYTTLAPCLTCAQLLINAGIARVIYAERYRDASGLELLATAMPAERYELT